MDQIGYNALIDVCVAMCVGYAAYRTARGITTVAGIRKRKNTKSNDKSGGCFVRKKSIGTIWVNGKSYTGSALSISNNKVVVDGVEQVVGSTENENTYNIKIEGNADVVNVGGCGNVDIDGDAGHVSNVSGDIKISGNSTKTSSVSGNISVAGSVSGWINTVSGSVSKSFV